MPFFNVMQCTVTASPFYTAMDDPGTPQQVRDKLRPV